ncbi:MAG: hypothetical protein KF873_16830 [Gemmataceae bacterium]|nr:hypothetical protein [Gemmataceae bacterium]
MIRLSAALALVVAFPFVSRADAPNPFDLVQGLRENGMSDLAIEYLDELGKKNPTAEMKILIPLESAKTRLLLAQQESDESVRDAAIALAKQDFGLFLLDHAKHPRAAEASLALARVLSLQAKTALNRASRIEVPVGEDGRPDRGKMLEKKAAFVAIRPLFKDATTRFGDAAKQMKALIDNPMTDGFRKRSLQREAMLAEMDRGINQFSLSETYLAAEGNEAVERGEALKQARQIFLDLSRQDTANPICWAARAWIGACELEIGDMGKAKSEFASLRADISKNPTAAADGVRMVEFFEAQNDYLGGRGGDLGAVRSAKVKAKNWLDKDKYKPRMTPERLSMTYYYAVLTQREAEMDNGNIYEKKATKDEGPRKLLNVSTNARLLLQESAREYKRLMEFDNDYTDRATRARMRAIRFIVGDANRVPLQYTNFEECLMAAQVRLASLDEKLDAIDKLDKIPATAKGATDLEEYKRTEKDKARTAVIALFERSIGLVGPTTLPKDATEARLWLARAYYVCDQPHQAAVAAEHVALTARGNLAAKAGVVAIESYLAARAKLDGNDADARKVDREHAIELGLAVDKLLGSDPATDNVRFRLGQLYLEDKEYLEAFNILSKVNLSFSAVAVARTNMGRAAYAIVLGKDSKITLEQKAEILRRAMTAAEAVPEPTNPNQLKSFFILKNILANLYLLQGGGGFVRAEAIAADTVKRTDAATMPEADKKLLRFSADEIRLRAVYGQCAPLYKDGKYKELADKMTPSLLALKQAGPAAKEVEKYRGAEPDEALGDTGNAVVAADGLDRFRRELIVLGLQGRIREGAVDQAAELFKLLEQLGGSVEATTDALARLVVLVRPQIDELKKQMKDDEAQKLTDVVGKLLGEQAAKEKLSARALAFLGRSLRDLGLYEKALEVLAKVPAVDEATLKLPTASLDAEKRDAVIAYQIAQIEQIRSYRLTKQFDKADELLLPAVGKDGKSGWAKSLEFRRERVFVMEDRATEAPKDKKGDLWKEAYAGWTDVLRPYVANVTARIPKDANVERVKQDREKLYPVILDLYVEEKRCLAKANTELLAANPMKLASQLNAFGKQIATLEKGYAKGLATDVRERFNTLLQEFPDMMAGYKEAGGVAFLDPTADLPTAAVPMEEKK